MEITPDKKKLIAMVNQAYEGTICLPDFQRDFVWTREEVADLMRSMLRSYFIGSLLLLESDPKNPPFAPVFLRGSSPTLNGVTAKPKPQFLLLDGQQRLSSLIYALYAPPNLGLKDTKQQRWFFVDLQLLIDDPYDDQIVFERSANDLDGLNEPEVQYRRRILPCTALGSNADYMRWRDGFSDWLEDNEPENRSKFRTKWRDLWGEAIDRFQNYLVSVIELPRVNDSDPEAIGRVCAIFEKMNSTGVPLTAYDLLTARLYRHGIKLHDLWDEACTTHRLLGDWSGGNADKDKFGIQVLRTVALLRRKKPTPRDIINLEPDSFEYDWRRAAAAIERALELLTYVGPDGFGVFERKWLPGVALIPALAALRAQIEHFNLGEGPRSDLRHWYWSNIFMERFSSAVESKSYKDYTELLSYWIDDGPEPVIFSEARATIGSELYSVRESAVQSGVIYSGVFCLLGLRNARDWTRGETIQLQDLQDHHIFPRGYLHSHGISRRASINSIVNRTLISDDTNRKIRAKAPAAYLEDPEVFPTGVAASLVEPHFLTSAALEAMGFAASDLSDEDASQAFDWFLDAREAAIIAEIRRVCEITP